MTRFCVKSLLAVSILSCGVTGCLDVRYTRFPTLYPTFPAAENLSYQQTDPFPDPDLGPSLDSAPRGYERPRSESRRAAEQRLLRGLQTAPETIPGGVPQGGLERPRAVY